MSVVSHCVHVTGGFLTDAGSLFDAEKVLLLCLSVCQCGHSVSQLLQGLECCIRYFSMLGLCHTAIVLSADTVGQCVRGSDIVSQQCCACVGP